MNDLSVAVRIGNKNRDTARFLLRQMHLNIIATTDYRQETTIKPE